MTSLRAVVPDDVRVIMCLAFDQHAPAAEVTRFKSCLLECEHVLHVVELTGSFDMMVEAKVASLSEYDERMGLLRTSVAHLIARYEANFICRRFVRHAGEDQAIWVPCQDGKVRIDHKMVDKVEAEGDYMRVHCAGCSHLVHMTMHAMADTLGEDFVLVHRSLLIRCDFIDRLIHRNNKWVARLNDGSHVIIAKSHVSEVMVQLHITPSKILANSSTNKVVVEQPSLFPSKTPGSEQEREVVMSLP